MILKWYYWFFIYYDLLLTFSSILILYTVRQIITYVIVMLLWTRKRKIIVMLTYVFFCHHGFWSIIFTFDFDSSAFLVDVWWSIVVIWSVLTHIINKLSRENCQNVLKLCFIINTICMQIYITRYFWKEVFTWDLW